MAALARDTPANGAAPRRLNTRMEKQSLRSDCVSVASERRARSGGALLFPLQALRWWGGADGDGVGANRSRLGSRTARARAA